MPELKRFTFRLPSELFDRIEQIAKSNYRSVNAEVIVAIEHYLKSIEIPPQTDSNQVAE